MTFPADVLSVSLKDTTADELTNSQFYINSADINQLQSEIFGIETQLGATNKLDMTVSGSDLIIAGPAQTIIGGLVVNVPGATVPFTIAGVTFVWVDDSGVIQDGAVLPTTSNYLPLAQVTHGALGVIITVDDLRPWLTGTGGGGGGGAFPANFRCTTSEPRYSQRDVVALAGVDFLPSGLIPLSDSAYFDIEIVSDTNGILTLVQREGATVTLIELGTVTAGKNERFRYVAAPLTYDGSATPLDYQLRLDVAATVEFASITEVEFDALCSTTVAGTGTILIPFQVPFIFSDVSPVALFSALAGDVLSEVEVVIQTAFDGAGGSLQVGVAGDLGAMLSASQISHITAGQYATIADRTSAIAESYLLTIIPGTATQGSGYVAGVIRR